MHSFISFQEVVTTEVSFSENLSKISKYPSATEVEMQLSS